MLFYIVCASRLLPDLVERPTEARTDASHQLSDEKTIVRLWLPMRPQSDLDGDEDGTTDVASFRRPSVY